MPEVTICEMGPRDGLQYLGRQSNPPRPVPLERRLALIEALTAAGLPYIEVGAFVSPKVIPQMADSLALAQRLSPRSGVQLAALVPNLKHYETFRQSGLDTVAVFVSASQRYAQANWNASADQVLAAALEVAAAAQGDGKRLRAHVSAALASLDHAADADLPLVLRCTRELRAAGCTVVALADTNGETDPRRLRVVLDAVKAEIGLAGIGVHLHDRCGMGLVNAFAAFEAGVRIFDGSIGGVGGSAIASQLGGAARRTNAGNVATDELVELFERLGAATGVQRDGLVTAGQLVREITVLTGDPPPPSRWLTEHP